MIGDVTELREVYAHEFGSRHNQHEPVPPLLGFKPGIGFIVLFGERRWKAMVENGVPLYAYVARNFDDVLNWMVLDAKRPGGTPFSYEEAARAIEKIHACMRIRKYHYIDDVVCSYANVDKNDMQATRSVMKYLAPEYPDEIRTLARADLNEISKGTVRPNSAYERIKRAYLRMTAPVVPVEQQRKMLDNLSAAVTGMTDALQAIGVPSPDLTPQEARAYAVTLGRARLHLERLIKQLNEKGRSSS